MVHGIGHGSRYYFNKPPSAMTPRECAFLAAMLPGPRVAYNPYRNIDKVLKRSDMILGLLRKNGVLSEDEYLQALAEMPNVGRLQRKVDTSIQTPVVMENVSSARQKPSSQSRPDEKESEVKDPTRADQEAAPVSPVQKE